MKDEKQYTKTLKLKGNGNISKEYRYTLKSLLALPCKGSQKISVYKKSKYFEIQVFLEEPKPISTTACGFDITDSDRYFEDDDE